MINQFNHIHSSQRSVTAKYSGPLIVTLFFFIEVIINWRRWGNVIIDFGREVYIPWQIVSGKTLYKDIAYYFGPLAPYLNATSFYIFGVSITTIFICNLILVAYVTFIIYRFFERLCDKVTATYSCLIFLGIFVFPFSYRGIFNYVSPYDHNITYGFVLAVTMIYLLSNFLYRPRLIVIIAAGICAGLVFLTKAEVFISTFITAAVAMIIIRQNHESNIRIIILLFIVSMLVPFLIFFIFLSVQMPMMQALKGIAANWISMLNTEITNIPFYKYLLGIDKPMIHIFASICAFLAILLLIASVSVIDLFKGKIITNRSIYILSLLVLSIISISTLYLVKEKGGNIILSYIGYSLVLMSFALTVVGVILFTIYRNNLEAKIRYSIMIIWFVFGLTLLAKMILHPRIYGYGFVLAVPATLGLIIAFLWLIPRLLNQFFGRGRLFRLISIVALSGLVLGMFIFYSISSFKTNRLIGKDSDRFYVSDPAPKVEAINQMMAFIKSSIPPQDTLVVIPEGAMFNYLTRHPSSIPLISFIPGEIAVFGETGILKLLKKQPPDFILLVHRLELEYGKGFFGSDPTNGKQIMDWVKENYQPILLLGAEPLKDNNFGIKLLRLNPDIRK
jgi:hypothetical protein